MDLCINHVNSWFPDCENSTLQQALKQAQKTHEWPTLTFVPAMQRRRLTPFAKIALHVANKTADHAEEHLPIIFSSRHGDIHNTSTLLADLTAEIPLSPTAFSLSVHNAIPSLFSILTKNKQAINAISAGKDTFFMSLVDAYARLTSGMSDKILFIHADQKLPESYYDFKDEIQLSHAVAMIISLPNSKEIKNKSALISITMEHHLSNDNNHLPAALAFVHWFSSTNKIQSFNSSQYHWVMSKYV